MKIFFDSSAFAKRYIDESGSEAVDDLCAEAGELGLGVICIPEILSALNRRVRERSLSRKDFKKIKERFAEEIRDAIILNITAGVLTSCTTILEASPVRAMDALHVACALEWEADLFVSSDARQLTAAKKASLRTKSV